MSKHEILPPAAASLLCAYRISGKVITVAYIAIYSTIQWPRVLCVLEKVWYRSDVGIVVQWRDNFFTALDRLLWFC